MSQRANLVNLERVTKSYGVRILLDEVSLGVGEGDHVGIVGRNGDGKTTLLDLMAGREEPDGGRVSRTRASGLWVGTISVAVLAVLFLIFIVQNSEKVTIHSASDIGASIASGSNLNDAMIIVPCSMGTLACVAGLAVSSATADFVLLTAARLVTGSSAVRHDSA